MMLYVSSLMVLSTIVSSVNTPGPVGTDAERLGIGARYLVVAGWSSGEIAAVYGRLRDATDARTSLVVLEQEESAASAALTQVTETLNAAPRDTEVKNQVAAAKQRYAAAKTAVETQRVALRATALSTVAQERTAALERLWRRAASPTPIAWRVLDCSDDDWRALELALKAEQAAARDQTTITAEQQARLSNARGDTAICAAQSRLTSGLSAAMEAVSGF